MFFGWLLAVGGIDLVIILSLFISKKWLPLAVLGIPAIILMMYGTEWQKKFNNCYRIPAAVILTLIVSALVMIVINIGNGAWEPGWVKPQPHNEIIPYICALILYPIATIFSLIYLSISFNPFKLPHNPIVDGNYTERGMIVRLYQQESKIQLWMLFYFSLFLSALEWIYYFTHYINVNYNSSDRFFFLFLPSILTLLTIIFFYIRYNMMWKYYCKNPMMEKVHGTQTALRYIIITGDYIFLEKGGHGVVDTPAKCYLPFTTAVSEQQAINDFREITGLKPKKLINAFESEDSLTLANAFHFICVYDSESDLQGCKLHGQFYTYDRVVKMMRKHQIAPELRFELERIYTVAMTWKTYTPEGKRIYPVRHYRPSFRFRDIKNYNVDYNDKNWLNVRFYNEDRPFYRFRRFLKKHARSS